MKNSLFIFAVAIVVAIFVQTTIFPIPVGLLLILVWFLRKQTENLVFLVLIFSFGLALISNMPAWIILAATVGGLFAFIVGKAVFPSRVGVYLGLLVASLAVWEVTVQVLSKIPNL